MKQNGFTMLEIMITLGLVSLIVLFTWPSISNSQQSAIERAFWQNFQQSWREAQLRSKESHQQTAVKFDYQAYQIEFSWIENHHEQRRNLVIPETLEVVTFEPFTMHENGYTRARTQEFVSSINKRHYWMKIQLAWGGYRLDYK